jgi:hypothetical protein
MNKSKSDNWRTLHILLAFFVVMLALSIYAIYSFKIYNESVEDREVYVKDNKYKVILEQVVEDGIFAPYRTRVTLGKNIENDWTYKELFEMSYRIRGAIRKDNYTIDWIDGGVIIKVTGVEKEKDMTYRIYWEDVF